MIRRRRDSLHLPTRLGQGMLSVILALSLSPTLALAQSSQDGDIGASVAVTEPAAAPANGGHG